ncbi:MAG: PmbA/TldA family metallopeptidase [Promethearchaeota archaeon]|jgi:predicted Zn-dependent protease
MNINSDIFSLAQYGLSLIEQTSQDVKCAELFFEKNKYISIEIEENSLKNSEIGEDNGVGVRIINRKGALGFAFSNKLIKPMIETLCITALKMMKTSTPDPDFDNFPHPYKTYPVLKGLHDTNIKTLQIEDSIGYVNQ